MYKKFADFYDEANSSDFYKHYTRFIKGIIKENKIKKVQLLDLACGTGRLIQQLKSFCSTIEGADSSQEMLEIAKNKDKKIKYYHQGFLNLDTKKKYNVIVSTFDSVNYLTNQRDLGRAFEKVAKHLISGGLFIFDFNTIHKKLNKEIKKGNITYHNLIRDKYWFVTIDIKIGQKIFREQHQERFYSLAEVESTLKERDLQVVSVHSSFNKKRVEVAKEPRLFLVAKK
ncbi:MAG: methyltransferase domain-containing protein [Candidatus Magasanikbacteria bacterium]|nr:methyltransferase domain-containing protein [Candidatus Magasanikbacteria bacterium]